MKPVSRKTAEKMLRQANSSWLGPVEELRIRQVARGKWIVEPSPGNALPPRVKRGGLQPDAVAGLMSGDVIRKQKRSRKVFRKHEGR